MGMAGKEGITMKTPPVLACVQTTDEWLVFTVVSPDSGKTYRVDKSLWYGSGSCSCENFCCRIQPRLGSGDWAEPTACKHIGFVDRYLALQVAQRAIEERKGKKHYNASEPNL